MLATVLATRFPTDTRIPDIAARLAALDPAEALARITTASTLDEFS